MRSIFEGIPLIPAIKAAIAAQTGDADYARIRPPFVELGEAHADAVTDAGVSSAGASLLLPEERGVAAEEEAALGHMPPLPQSSPDQGGTSAARSEWLALQQELQIVSMHGRRLQAGGALRVMRPCGPHVRVE